MESTYFFKTMTKVSYIDTAATFSACQKYRYQLIRKWRHGNDYVLFICLNPSTADATQDDPTVRRCVDFAQRWGYAGMVMANIFAYRSTDPQRIYEIEDPIGPENNAYLKRLHNGALLTVAAWGNHGTLNRRDEYVRTHLLYGLKCFGLTKAGQPKHPLYLPKATELREYIYPIPKN